MWLNFASPPLPATQDELLLLPDLRLLWHLEPIGHAVLDVGDEIFDGALGLALGPCGSVRVGRRVEEDDLVSSFIPACC